MVNFLIPFNAINFVFNVYLLSNMLLKINYCKCIGKGHMYVKVDLFKSIVVRYK